MVAGPPGLPGPPLLRLHGQGSRRPRAVPRPPGVRARRAVRRRVGPDRRSTRTTTRRRSSTSSRWCAQSSACRSTPDAPGPDSRRERRRSRSAPRARAWRGDAAGAKAEPAEADPADRGCDHVPDDRRRGGAAVVTDDVPGCRGAGRVQGCADVPEPERDRADDAARGGRRRRAGRGPGSPPGTRAPRPAQSRAGCVRAGGRRPRPARRRRRARPGSGCPSGRGPAGRRRRRRSRSPRSRPSAGRARCRGVASDRPGVDAGAAHRGRQPRRGHRAGERPHPLGHVPMGNRPPPEHDRGHQHVRPEPPLLSGRNSVARATRFRPETSHRAADSSAVPNRSA